jgi:hypothetical protein
MVKGEGPLSEQASRHGEGKQVSPGVEAVKAVPLHEEVCVGILARQDACFDPLGKMRLRGAEFERLVVCHPFFFAPASFFPAKL